MRVVVTVLTLGCAFPCPLVGQTPRDLIDGVIAAYGGREALARVTGYEMRGTMESRMRGGQATTIRTFERPSRLRVVLHYPQRVEARILDGQRGWRGNQSGLVAASGPLLAAMRLQAARAAIPWILDEHRADARSAPPLTVNDYVYQGVEITVGDGLTLRAYVDSTSHYVVNVQTHLATPAMSTVFETIYAEFREVDGVFFAFWEENFASGTHTGSTTFEAVVVNPDLDEGTFGPRGGRD